MGAGAPGPWSGWLGSASSRPCGYNAGPAMRGRGWLRREASARPVPVFPGSPGLPAAFPGPRASEDPAAGGSPVPLEAPGAGPVPSPRIWDGPRPTPTCARLFLCAGGGAGVGFHTGGGMGKDRGGSAPWASPWAPQFSPSPFSMGLGAPPGGGHGAASRRLLVDHLVYTDSREDGARSSWQCRAEGAPCQCHLWGSWALGQASRAAFLSHT